ncbi:MAG: hypothetical protein J5497_08820, partial [Selenomonadaceae bacterium]|nr:hypothetical protein [Selenomonadaceae bacterium]
KSNDEFSMRLQWLIKFTAEHRRVFFVSPNNLPAVKIIFDIQSDEEIIELRNLDSVKELIIKMREYNRQKIVLLFQENFDAFKGLLSGQGFHEYVHYANGLSFMARAQCGYTHREWNLIRNM